MTWARGGSIRIEIVETVLDTYKFFYFAWKSSVDNQLEEEGLCAVLQFFVDGVHVKAEERRRSDGSDVAVSSWGLVRMLVWRFWIPAEKGGDQAIIAAGKERGAASSAYAPTIPTLPAESMATECPKYELASASTAQSFPVRVHP
jgi:hypothetical protein